MGAMIRHMLAITSVLLSTPAVFAASLDDYVGEWRGTGTFERQGSQERTGRLHCRLTIVRHGETAIVVRGRCAAPEGSRGFQIRIVETPGGGLAAENVAPANARPKMSVGMLDGGGIRLRGDDGAFSTHFLLSDPASGEMRMQSGASGGGNSESADVGLKRVN